MVNVQLLLSLLCLGFSVAFLWQICTVNPLLAPPLKFKFKSKKGLAHYGQAAAFIVPGVLIMLAPILMPPVQVAEYAWQPSIGVWTIVLSQVYLRNYSISLSAMAFSILYFIVTTILGVTMDDPWLLLASGASAVPACLSAIRLTSRGVEVARKRRRGGLGFREISSVSEEDELIPNRDADNLDVDQPDQKFMPPSGYQVTGFNLLAFDYLSPIISIGATRQISQEDIPMPAPDMTADEVGRKKLGSVWKAEAMNPSPSLSKVLVRVFGRDVLLAGGIKVGNDLCNFVQPLLLQSIIEFMQAFQTGDAEMWHGLWLAFCMLLSYVIQSASFNQYFQAVNVVSSRARSSLMWLIFDKSSKLSSEGRANFSSGAVQNLMANDARRLSDLMMFINYLWSGVFQICVAFVLLVRLLGAIPTFAGITICVLNSPLQTLIMARVRAARERALTTTDERVKILSEVFQGIKVIKFYAWEDSFITRILKIRAEELRWIRSALLYSAGSFTMVSTLPVILSTVSIAVYALMGNSLNPAIIFPAIALLNVLRAPLLFLPNVLISLAQAKASINRLERFLAADEVLPASRRRPTQKPVDDNVDVMATDATFCWEKSPASDVNVRSGITGVNLEVRRGDMCIIMGATGSGKSTLLSGLLNEAFLVSGTYNVRPGAKIAYVDQTAFIFNATLRENILFGADYDEARYQKAIRVCALEHDFELLTAGDMTEIGSRGVNLSGGQRQRVSLARAVYADADIYLLDDPLSAVDAAVGKHIFDDCITGALKDKSRLFVTNQIQFISAPGITDICFLDQGQVREMGTYEELMAKDGLLAQLVKKHGSEDVNETQEDHGTAAEAADGAQKPAEKADGDKAQANTGGQLTTKETRETGKIRLRSYLEYVNAFGGLRIFAVLMALMFSAQACSIGSTVWLSIWSATSTHDDSHFMLYFGGYALLSFLSVLVTATASVASAFAAVRASRMMHQNMLFHVLGAPILWFDSTPLGRLINRFNSDIDKIDSTLMSALQGFLRQTMNLMGVFALVIAGVPLFIIPMTIAGIFYFRVQDYYRKSSVDLRRLEAVVRSPLYNHFAETLDGLVTLRAYGQIWRAKKLNEEMIDTNTVVSFTNLTANRWLSVRLEVLSIGLVFSVTLLSVLAGGRLSPAFAGLILSYALQLTTTMTWVIRTFTDAESQMSAVERVLEYTREELVPQEEKLQGKEAKKQLRRDWPRRGRIDVNGITMRYRPDLPPVLHSINFSVEGGEKIGICGRTGAGKSSLVNVLFRLTPVDGGQVLIDDIDTQAIPLRALRGALSIIPQEPLIFSGTIRSNLDPFGERIDEEIWRVLRICGLVELVSRSGEGLDAPIAESGSNLSVGQRQLLCLGRALLRETRILILDEATSGVDVETDQRMQGTITNEFKNCTIMTIAHRLNTIIGYDRILVLDAGEIVEFDTPKALLDNPSSVFSSLVDDLGPSMSAKLRSIAACGDSATSQLIPDAAGSPSEKPGRDAVIKDAFVELRNAIVNHDAVDWTEELSRAGITKREWSDQLMAMSQKLYRLSQAYLSESEAKPYKDDYRAGLENAQVAWLSPDPPGQVAVADGSKMDFSELGNAPALFSRKSGDLQAEVKQNGAELEVVSTSAPTTTMPAASASTDISMDPPKTSKDA